MSPKDKAENLVGRFVKLTPNSYLVLHKQCALIAVDEILDGFRKLLPSSRGYWQQVRTEIENL